MEGSFSPILRKIAGEVISKPKRSFRLPTQVCLEEWWLSKVVGGDGLAISGRPFDTRSDDTTRSNLSLASPTKRCALREFHSTKILKRHGATLLETSDGIFISLCGFINKCRTQQNGLLSEICRDFIYGFPFNWNDYSAHSADIDSKSNENKFGSFTPAVLDPLSGAQLHDLVLSFTDTERDHFVEKISNMLILNPLEGDEFEVQCSKPSLTSVCTADGLAPDDSISKASMKQRTKIEQSSISTLPSPPGLDIQTPNSRNTKASKTQKRNASTPVSSGQPSISSPSSLSVVTGLVSDKSSTKASKKQRRTASRDISS